MSWRRTRADWPIVVAALLTMLLATTLLAAGPMYSAGVSVAGLRQLLAGGTVEAANIQVTARVPLERVDAVDGLVAAELAEVAGPLPAELSRSVAADTFALPGQGEQVRDLAQTGYAEGVERHATLIAGAWPDTTQGTAGAGGTAEPVAVAISDAVADELALDIGDELELPSRRDPAQTLSIRIAAVFRIDDPSDPFWWSDTRAIDGFTDSAQYRTFGPFLMSRADLLSKAAASGAFMFWRLVPDYSGITADDVGGLSARLAALPDRLQTLAPAEAPLIASDLPATLSGATRALLVSRTGMLLVMGQLALLGGYSILLTAGLLLDHRRVETALLRSRGAAPTQVGGLGLAEGVLLAVPAVVLGPWCALVAVGLFEAVGPLRGVGLSVPLTVSTDSYLAAGAAGVACVLLMALPALFSARSFRTEQQALSRGETRPLAQRLGIDIALLAVAAVALWQLQLYGAPLTRTVQGSLGADPLLVAAPALGLLAGAVIAMRLLPRLAEAAQELFARGRGLVGALGSFQLARRPLRYTRSALMLTLAMSIGVFAVSYATTWTQSQNSQADHQAGADVRVVPSRFARTQPAWSLAQAYAQLPEVKQAMPVERYDVPLQRAVRATVLTLDARAAAGIVRFGDVPDNESLEALLAPLAQARPDVHLPQIPEPARELVIVVQSDVRALEQSKVDPVSGEELRTPADPGRFATEAAVGVSVAVRDVHGLIHRFAGPVVTAAEAERGIIVPVTRPVPGGGEAQPDGPLGIVSVDVSEGLPAGLVVTDADIRVASITIGGGEESNVLLGAARSWRIAWVAGEDEPFPVAATGAAPGVSIGAAGSSGAPPELATPGIGAPVVLSMQPVALADLVLSDIPVVVNRATLEAMAITPLDTLRVDIAGARRDLRIAGVVDTFPTLDAGKPLIVADLPTLALLRAQAAHDLDEDAGASEISTPREWWLTIAAPADPQVADRMSATLSAAPFASLEVTTAAGRLRSLLSDPIALGIIGALSLGAVAAGLFALIGICVAASVSVRQRQGEFALLRALGLSRRQLYGSLWLENGTVALFSLVAGTALGMVISIAVLPSATMTGNGLPPTPAVTVAVPLMTIVLLALVAATVLVAVFLVMLVVLPRTAMANVLRLGEE